jgi:hypothetical protein
VYDHVAEIVSYLGAGQVDFALVNTGVPEAHVVERHRRDGLFLLGLSAEELRKIGDLRVQVVAGNLIEAGSEQRLLWNKQDAIRHDPQRVGMELAGIVGARGMGEVAVARAPVARAAALEA